MSHPTPKATPKTDSRGPHVITVASGKGGVGKTHVSVNVAHTLARQKHRVLLIDGDLGLANVDVLLGLSPAYHAGHLLDGEQPFENVVTRIDDHLHVLPAGSALSRLAELDMAEQVHLLHRLDLQHQPYDFVLIDAGAGIGANVRLTLSMAHEILVVMLPEMTSLTDAYALVKVADRAGCKGPFRVVVNRVKAADQAREMFACLDSAARSFLSMQLGFLGYIYRDQIVEKAVRAQKPFVELAPEAPASRCIETLAKRLGEARGASRSEVPSAPRGSDPHGETA